MKVSSEGTVIEVEVQPGSKSPGKFSYDQWRKAIRLTVGGIAQKGKANTEVVSVVAGILQVRENSVRIISGQKDRRKSVLVCGVVARDVIERLESVLRER